jgi:hypothetical protein
MFSRLQIYLLAGCTVLVIVAFAAFQFWSRPIPQQPVPQQQAIAPAPDDSQPDAASSPERQRLETVPDATPPRAIKQTSPFIVKEGNEADEKTIDAAMDKFGRSFLAGDYSVALDVMYGPFVEAVGGREKANEQLKAAMDEMKRQEATMTSWKTKKPYTYIAGKSHKYVIIPYEIKMTISKKLAKRTGYELGIKTTGSDWQFMMGDNLTSELFDQFFPDFPKDIELPEPEQVWE